MQKIGLLLLYFVVLFVAASALGLEAQAFAQGEAKTATTHPEAYRWTDHEYGYLNPVKIVALFILFWVWVWTTDWVGQDCQDRKLPQETWVTANVFVFSATFWLLAAFIPLFLGYLLAVAAWAVPLGLYIRTRNQIVDIHERVLTADHLRYVMSSLSGGKVDAEKKEAWDTGPQMEIKSMGGDDAQNTHNLYQARKLPDAYVWLKELIAEMVMRRSTKVMMDYTRDTVGMRYLIDGVWLAGENRDRASSDQLLTVMKLLCNLKPEERRARQSGEFFVKYDGQKMTCKVGSQGTQSGERVLFEVPTSSSKLDSLSALGMRDAMIQEAKDLMLSPKGMFVFSARPEGGLTTLFQAGLLSTDRLMRDFVGFEPANSEEPEILNVSTSTYDMQAGQKPEDLIPTLARSQPDAFVARVMETKTVFELMLDQANDKRIVFTSSPVKEDGAEAILRLLAMKVDPKEFAKALIGVLNTRLCRRLCRECRQEFVPNPQLLKKLGIPEGSVEKLYRSPPPPGPDDPPVKPCESCGGIGFVGQIGIFELIKVNDGIRNAIIKSPTLEAVRAASRAAGNRTLQEEAIRLVATGVTSLEEVSRVLKEK